MTSALPPLPSRPPQVEQAARLLPEVTRLLESNSELSVNTMLRAQGHDPEVIRSALEQAALLRKADASWINARPGWLLTRDGLEQATHPSVAEFHAGVVAAAGVRHVVDLTAGLGSDTVALARQIPQVTAVEQDPATAELLAFNLTNATNVTIAIGDSSRLEFPDADGFFVDPARRSGTRSADGSRALPERDPERWSPPLSEVMRRAQGSLVFMKAAPAFNAPQGWAQYFISRNGNLIESFCTNASIGNHAVILDSDSTTVLTQENISDAPAGTKIGGFMFEVDPAIIRAGLSGPIAQSLGLEVIGAGGMWLTGSVAPVVPYLRNYNVLETFPLRELKAHVQSLPGVALKTKDSRVDIDSLRKKIKKPDSNEWAVIFTSVAGEEICVLAQRAPK